jgi:hypothetical protein
MTKTIKITSSTYELLNKLSKKMRLSIDATLDKLVIDEFNRK